MERGRLRQRDKDRHRRPAFQRRVRHALFARRRGRQSGRNDPAEEDRPLLGYRGQHGRRRTAQPGPAPRCGCPHRGPPHILLFSCSHVQRHRRRYFGRHRLGYRTQDTDGNDYYVWRLKGTFSIPDQTNVTEDDGTDANGQEITFTGISTTHKFTKTNAPAKAITVDTSVNAVDESTFFGTVQTPDTVTVTP